MNLFVCFRVCKMEKRLCIDSVDGYKLGHSNICCKTCLMFKTIVPSNYFLFIFFSPLLLTIVIVCIEVFCMSQGQCMQNGEISNGAKFLMVSHFSIEKSHEKLWTLIIRQKKMQRQTKSMKKKIDIAIDFWREIKRKPNVNIDLFSLA